MMLFVANKYLLFELLDGDERKAWGDGEYQDGEWSRKRSVKSTLEASVTYQANPSLVVLHQLDLGLKCKRIDGMDSKGLQHNYMDTEKTRNLETTLRRAVDLPILLAAPAYKAGWKFCSELSFSDGEFLLGVRASISTAPVLRERGHTGVA